MKTGQMRLVVPPDDRVSNLETARQAIKDELAKLRQTTKSCKASKRLIAALEALHTKGQDPQVQEAGTRTIKERLVRLKKVTGQLRPGQRRDLKIILFFNSGNLPLDMRADAIAILKLRGTDASIAEVCRVFPGLAKMFDE
jgi:hypothetical protein